EQRRQALGRVAGSDRSSCSPRANLAHHRRRRPRLRTRPRVGSVPRLRAAQHAPPGATHGRPLPAAHRPGKGNPRRNHRPTGRTPNSRSFLEWPMATRILVVDDHPVVREGLVAMLGTEPAFDVVGEAANGDEAASAAANLRPDVVLMDIELPPTDGIEATAAVLEACPSARVIVFTAFDSEERIVNALRAGAQGYLLKGVPREELFAAIRTVSAGGTTLQPEVAAKLARRVAMGEPRAPQLTPRQLEVLRLLSRGAANKEI